MTRRRRLAPAPPWTTTNPSLASRLVLSLLMHHGTAVVTTQTAKRPWPMWYKTSIMTRSDWKVIVTNYCKNFDLFFKFFLFGLIKVSTKFFCAVKCEQFVRKSSCWCPCQLLSALEWWRGRLCFPCCCWLIGRDWRRNNCWCPKREREREEKRIWNQNEKQMRRLKPNSPSCNISCRSAPPECWEFY